MSETTLRQALDLLNWRWGKGDVTHVDATHAYYRTSPHGIEGRFRYHVDGQTVRALRHRVTL